MGLLASYTAKVLLFLVLLFQWPFHVLGFGKAPHIDGFYHFSSDNADVLRGRDPFANNHRIEFAWDDALLQERLWEGKHRPAHAASSKRASISKRVTGQRTTIQSTWPHRHCLGCFNAASGDTMDIGDLSTEYLVTELLKTEPEMRDHCVFYTGVPDSERRGTSKGQSLAPKENLSPSAARWACDRQMFSLWSLFPGEDSNVAPPGTVPPESITRKNFWEIDRQDSWLYHLKDPPTRFTYFENMSRAMARRCSGKVFVYSLNPQNLAWYGTQKPPTPDNNNAFSIWNSVEFKELQAQNKWTQLIAIDASTGSMYRLNMNDQSVIGPYTGTVPRGLENAFNSTLGKRDTCTQNLLYQAPGDDWFGTGRRSSSS